MAIIAVWLLREAGMSAQPIIFTFWWSGKKFTVTVPPIRKGMA